MALTYNLNPTPLWDFTSTSDNSGASTASFGDIDGDGDLDLFIGVEKAAGSQGSMVFKNDGSGNFTKTQTFTAMRVVKSFLLNIDGDANLELITRSLDAPISIFENNGSGTFSLASTTSATVNDVAVGDLDGDGDVDMFIALKDGGYQVYKNDGTGTFTISSTPASNSTPLAVALADLDKDGDLDAVSYEENNGRILLNNGSGTFSSGSTFGDVYGGTAISADVTGDGYGDILTNAIGSSNGLNLYQNNGSGGLGSLIQNFSGGSPYKFADVDSDGDLDGFSGDLYLNNGTGTLTAAGMTFQDPTFVNYGTPVNGTVAGAGDVDGDGDKDLVVIFSGYDSGTYSSRVSVFINNSAPPANADGTLTAGTTVIEPVSLATTIDTAGEAIDVFDFKLTDGGTSDGLALGVSQLVLHTSGTGDFSKVTWRLNGPDATNVAGTYNNAAHTLTFSGLTISVANGGNETYKVNAYYSNSTSLTEGQTYILSIDGDTDVTVAGGGTTMASGQTSVTNGAGTAIDVTATKLVYSQGPSGTITSGIAFGTQPVVQAVDDHGNVDKDFNGSVTLSGNGAGIMSGTTTISATSGIAIFSGIKYTANSDADPNFDLTASAASLTSATISNIDTDVVATKLIFDTQPAPTNIISGQNTGFTTVPVIKAVDASNTLDTGYTTNMVLSVTDPNDGIVDGTINGLTVTSGDQDGSGTTVTIAPSNGSATLTGLALQYTNSGATDSIALKATSGALTTANSSTIISTTNSPPTVTTPTTISYTDTSSDDTFTNTSATLSASDSDGTIASYGISGGTTGGSTDIGGTIYDISKAGSYGSLYVKSATGEYVYVPLSTAINAVTANQSETFTVTATDDKGSNGSATLTVNITGANDTPVLASPTSGDYTDTAASDTFSNITGTLSGSDRDSGTSLSYGITAGTTGGATTIGVTTYDVSKAGSYGSLYVKSTTGEYVYVPLPTAINAVTANQSDTFTVSVSDGSLSDSKTYTINISGTNDTPINTVPGTQTVAEDGVLTFSSGNGNTLSVADIDTGQTLTTTISVDSGKGSISVATGGGGSITGNGNNSVQITGTEAQVQQALATVTYTPTANAYGNSYATLTISSTDNGSGTLNDTDTVTINVTGVADTPSVTDSNTPGGTQTTGGLVISRNAADGAEVTNFKITAIANGTLYQNDGTTQISNGDFITYAQGNAGLKFTPNGSVNGSFTIQASTSSNDGGLGGSTATATITIDSPSISDSTYDASTGKLVVTGTHLPIAGGANNDIDASMFTFSGEGGEAYTLTNTGDVDIESATQFTLTLSANDKTAVNQIINKDGTSSTDNTSYNIAAASGWAPGYASTPQDMTSNPVTVSGVAVPAISSATYNVSTGVLLVTGTGFLKLNGATNDIDVSKLTVTGEGGGTHTLTTPSVEITSDTSFSATLNATDQAAIKQLFNSNGTASTGGTTYNLAAAEDWAAGANSAVTVADLTGNGITVSNVPVPTITSATYNSGTGVLVVTGDDFLKLDGTANDIVASLLTLTGKGSDTYSLTDTANADITSATQFTLILSSTDKAEVNLLLNKDGLSSNDNTVYNIAAAEDWAAGANAAVNVEDLTGNGITVTLNQPPVITSNGGGATASISIAENTAAVTTITATDADAGQTVTYSITGGADQAKFSINTNSGALSFASAPNFEAPTDTGSNNTYEVIVQANDGNGGTDNQTITVTVTDVNENVSPPPPPPSPDPTPTPTPNPVIPPQSDWGNLPDNDNDGVPEVVEGYVPGLTGGVTGDGNGDGVKDQLQGSVSSIPFLNTSTPVSNPGDASQVFLTLVGGSDQGKIDQGASPVTFKDVNQIDAPANLPENVQMPLGMISFTADIETPGTSESFSIYVDGSVTINGYWKQNSEGNWVNLASPEYGGQIVSEGGKTRLDFTILDGGEFDNDGKADGIITDPGAPGWRDIALAFDENYYLESKLAELRTDGLTQYVDIRQVKREIINAGMTVYEHFQKFSLSEGTNPNQYVNTAEYLQAKAVQLNSVSFDGRSDWSADDIKNGLLSAGYTNVLDHFSTSGWLENVNPSNSFDISDYLRISADAGGKSVSDFMESLKQRELDPFTQFITEGQNTAGVTVPAVSGSEKVITDHVNTSVFNEPLYLQSKLVRLITGGFTQFSNIGQISSGIAESGMTAFEHFKNYSLCEETDPNQFFDTSEYLQAKADRMNTLASEGRTDWTKDDVKAGLLNAGFTNAFDHFATYGWLEDVNPSSEFDVSRYLESYAAKTGTDLDTVIETFKNSGTDPLTNYLHYGQNIDGIAVKTASKSIEQNGKSTLDSESSFLSVSEVNKVLQDMTTFASNNGIAMTNNNDLRNSPDLMNIINTAWHAPA